MHLQILQREANVQNTHSCVPEAAGGQTWENAFPLKKKKQKKKHDGLPKKKISKKQAFFLRFFF